jgi:hypothetical protein
MYGRAAGRLALALYRHEQDTGLYLELYRPEGNGGGSSGREKACNSRSLKAIKAMVKAAVTRGMRKNAGAVEGSESREPAFDGISGDDRF